MKCQKCGINDVKFRYSLSLNGAVSETNLCAQCATGAGYDMVSLLDVTSMFEAFAPILGPGRYYLPVSNRTPAKAPAKTPSLDATCSCDHSTAETVIDIKDAVMAQRRELNMQMRIAVANEEFEKAAEIRDKLKELNT